MRYKSLGEMYFDKRTSMPDKVAYMYKKGGKWHKLTFKEVVDWAENISAGLASLGVKKGDRVALISTNRVEWAVADYAALALGAMLVPIYPSLLSDQVKYIINDAEAKVVIAADEIQMEKVDEVRPELEHARHFYVFDPPKELKEPWKKFEALAEAGVTYMSAHNQLFMPCVIEAKKMIDSGALGRIFYLKSHAQIPTIRSYAFNVIRSGISYYCTAY